MRAWRTVSVTMSVFYSLENIFFTKNVQHMVSILAEWKNSQNGTFESVHEIQKKFWPKDFFSGIMKVPFTEIICNLFQGPPNPVFRSVKVQISTFFKKDSLDFENSFHLGFL